MPNAPDTGTNKIRGASAKGREPAIQDQQIPSAPKFRADRLLQNATIHEPAHRLLDQMRMLLEPAVNREPESGFRPIQIFR
jgi:hypothetical protein